MQTSRATGPALPRSRHRRPSFRRRAVAPARRLALCGALIFPAPILAQAVLGPGDDASLARRGALRVTLLSRWTRFDEQYVGAGPGRADGSLTALGAPFTLDSIGVAQFENLGPVQTSVRTLAGMPDFSASLGASLARVRDHAIATPVAVELGLTRRITVGVTVPFLTATSSLDLRVNPTGREPTLGFNPTLGSAAALASNGALLAQFDSAASQLAQRLTSCATNPPAAGCAAVNAGRAGALALIADANAFAAGLGQLYGGRNGSAGAKFVPIAGTVAQAAIEARVAAFRALYAGYGAGALTGTVPLAAQAPFTVQDLQRVLTDSTFGVRARPLATAVTRGVGDIDLALKINLFDSFRGDAKARLTPSGIRWRQSIGGIYRLGTGALDAADDFTDLPVGDHQSDVEIQSYTDLLVGAHFWVSLVGRYNVQMADERVMRITAGPDAPLAAAYREHTVTRDLGDVLEIAVNPRWVLNEFVALAGRYAYRRKFADAYAGTFPVSDLNGQSVTLDAATLGLGTEAREHRFGGSVTYSTVAAFERGRARIPLEVSYLHFQTTRGALGLVPKLSEDQVQVRVYGRLFGRWTPP